MLKLAAIAGMAKGGMMMSFRNAGPGGHYCLLLATSLGNDVCIPISETLTDG